ncbi:putative Chitinase C [Glarea lozoyensis 74030]|uniref:Putative Chitinase C n=1 Tax=Glarea lozoyensis (strain ATCC 74030 / MF5533) TaxID=1104152 RepID=H0EIB3_GLAL7|nr:putative Chitinase C [Glarea lozoyensis 74030]
MVTDTGADAYPKLLSTLRKHLGPSKLITAAVPGLPRDMLAFTSTTIPIILPSIDFFNIMTYDLMNRRDSQTLHHAGVQASLTSINAYLSAGVPASKLNVGFAFYVKYFRTDASPAGRKKCLDAWNINSGIGCPTGIMEDPKTGGDLGKTGGFSWHDGIPSEVSESFKAAKTSGKWDAERGGYGYWDEKENLWWTWENEKAIVEKVERVVKAKGIEGAFAWGLGEDGDEFEHLQTLNKAYNGLQAGRHARNEL